MKTAAATNDKPLVIGILGGMGSYATVDLFHRIVDAFPGRYEWDRPRILIDNRCTMPSRVRAILYEENREELVDQMTQSTRALLDAGANRILYGCNTSHVFQDEVCAKLPEARGYLLDMIDLLAQDMSAQGVTSAYLLATEGTIQVGIFQQRFAPYGIAIESADDKQQPVIREFIEVVKQNKIDDASLEGFRDYLLGLGHQNVILGCTELPVLYRRINEPLDGIRIFDPMQSAIDRLVAEHHTQA